MNFLEMGAGASVWAFAWFAAVAILFAHWGAVTGAFHGAGKTATGAALFGALGFIGLMVLEYCLFHNPVPFTFFGVFVGFPIAYIRAFRQTDAEYRLPKPDAASPEGVKEPTPEPTEPQDLINAQTVKNSYFPGGQTFRLEFKTPEDAAAFRKVLERKLMRIKPEDMRP